MMDSKELFSFINSPLWLETTQAKYVTPSKIKHLIEKYGYKRSEWAKIEGDIEAIRKVNSYPFFVKSLEKNFWYFPTDEIKKQVEEITSKSQEISRIIEKNNQFSKAFIADARVEESIMSAIYEGANTTRSEAKQFISKKEEPKSVSQWMLFNNYQTNKWINENCNLTINSELIKNIHKLITKNTLDVQDAPYLGKFRDAPVFVGKSLVKGGHAHEGVKSELIESSLNEVIDLLEQYPRHLNPLIKAILFHYFIAFIHPFFDGNGRTARTMFYFFCLKNNLSWVNFLSISASLKNSGYEKAFELVKENKWDLTYFILHSLKALKKSLKVAEKKIENICSIPELSDKYQLNENQTSLLQRLYLHRHRIIDAYEHAENIEKSVESARKELKDLYLKEFLIEIKYKNKLLYHINKEKLDSFF